jgi:hypothetical protein
MSFVICTFSYYQDDKLKEDEMGGTCSKQGRERNIYRMLAGNFKGRGNLEDVT